MLTAQERGREEVVDPVADGDRADADEPLGHGVGGRHQPMWRLAWPGSILTASTPTTTHAAMPPSRTMRPRRVESSSACTRKWRRLASR